MPSYSPGLGLWGVCLLAPFSSVVFTAFSCENLILTITEKNDIKERIVLTGTRGTATFYSNSALSGSGIPGTVPVPYSAIMRNITRTI
jgi:hypothetical protein